MGFLPQYVTTPNCEGTKFQNSDGSTSKTIWTPGESGGRVEGINICHDESKTNYVVICFNDGTTNYPIVQVLLSSTSTKVSINALEDLTFQSDLQGVIIPAGCTLTAYMTSALNSGKYCDIFVMGGDF